MYKLVCRPGPVVDTKGPYNYIETMALTGYRKVDIFFFSKKSEIYKRKRDHSEHL